MTDPVSLPYWLLIALMAGPLLVAVPFAWHCGRRECDGEWRARWRDWCRSTEAEIQQDYREHYGVAPLRVVEGGKGDSAA